MLDRIQKTVESHGLWEPGAKVVVALSGGPDSVALLCLLDRLRIRYSLAITAVYINHGLRPRAARREELFCADLCRKLDIDLVVERIDIRRRAEVEGTSLETAGRDYRYRILEKIRTQLRYDLIATGHHRDDQAETVLYRIIRGTGLDGLMGIRIKRGRVVRPLLEVGKQELLDWLEKSGIEYCIDSTNESTRFARNVVRNRVLPLIRSRINAGVDSALVNLSANLSSDLALLGEITQRTVQKCVKTSPGGKIQVDLDRFGSYSPGLRARVLRHCLTINLGLEMAPDREVIERLDDLAMRRNKGISLPGRIRAQVVSDKMFLFKEIKVSFRSPLEIGDTTVLDWPSFTFKVGRTKKSGETVELERQSMRVRLDAQAVSFPLTVRSLKPGDRFRPLGMRGSKKVSDFLIDRKLPAPLRNEAVVVCDQKGIVWLVGQEIADRVKIEDTTTEVIEIECSRRRIQSKKAKS